MPLITLGLSGELGHDAAAALFIDGEIVAAVEEERLVRRKHAKGMMPVESALGQTEATTDRSGRHFICPGIDIRSRALALCIPTLVCPGSRTGCTL